MNKSEKPEPGYFAIIPADVRYDKNLSPSAKLLYGELTALSKLWGYCNAGNKYFSDLYGVSKSAISQWIAQLKKAGYISVDYDKKNFRKIYLQISSKVSEDSENSPPDKAKLNTLKATVFQQQQELNTLRQRLNDGESKGGYKAELNSRSEGNETPYKAELDRYKAELNRYKAELNRYKAELNSQNADIDSEGVVFDPSKKPPKSTYKKTFDKSSSLDDVKNDDDDDREWFLRFLSEVVDAGFPNVTQWGLQKMRSGGKEERDAGKEGYSKEEIENAFRHVRALAKFKEYDNPAGEVWTMLRSGLDLSDAPLLSGKPAKAGRFYGDMRRGAAIPEPEDLQAVLGDADFFPKVQQAAMNENLYVGKLLKNASLISSNGFCKIAVPEKFAVAISEFRSEVENAIELVCGESLSVEFVAQGVTS